MGLFGSRSSSSGGNGGAQRLSRHSSAWAMLSKHMRAAESLRVLDIGPTSATNINYSTELGHSIYMANLVEDAARQEFLVVDPETGQQSFNIEAFLARDLDFGGRTFDVVLFWDTADYLPQTLIGPLLERIHSVMSPGGKLLALFHAKLTGTDTTFCRYHLTATDNLDMQRVGGCEMKQIFTARQIEAMFASYAGTKFFLAKDALREVIVTR